MQADPGRRVVPGHRREPGDGGRRGGRRRILGQEPDGPAPDVLALVAEERHEGRFIQPARDVQGPDRAEHAGRLASPPEDLPEGAVGLRHVLARRRALLEDPAGVADVPVVLVELERDQFPVARPREVDAGGPGRAVGDLVDAPVLALGAVRVGLVALVGVGPVDEEGGAVGAGLDRDPAEPGVVGHEEVGRVARDVARALATEAVVVDPVAVDVAGEERVAIAVGPGAALVDHRPDVGMAAAGLAVLAGPPARVLPAPAGPVDVVGRAAEQAVGVRVGVLAVHPLVVRPGHDVVEVRDDAVGDERLAEGVEVEPPGVRRAVRHDLEDLAGRVVAPDAAVEGGAVLLGRPRRADAGVGQDPVAPPEPAVGAPDQAVEHVVLGLGVPAVEDHLGLAVGGVVAVAVGQEQEVRRGADPDPAEAELEAGDVGPPLPEDLARVEVAVAVAVLEDEDAVALADIRVEPGGVAVALGDPEPAPVVEGHGDRLADVGLAGEEGDGEALRHRHLRGGLAQRHGGLPRRARGLSPRGRVAGERRHHEQDQHQGEMARTLHQHRLLGGTADDPASGPAVLL